MGQLTRKEMEEVIQAGGSVLLNDHAGVGQIHSTLATLPTEADLAVGHEDRERIVADSLDAQIAALANQKNQLTRAREDRAQREKDAKTDDKARARDANENPDTAKGEIPGSGIGGKVTQLPPQGDRVAAETLERQNERERGEEGGEDDAALSGESADDEETEDADDSAKKTGTRPVTAKRGAK